MSLATAGRLALLGCLTGIAWAGNVCDERVPGNQTIDGIPAHAQCGASTSSAIWSNNGVDTNVATQGEGWIRTQGNSGYQCTELARRYLLFRWNVNYQGGVAKDWCDGKLPATLVRSATPVHGDLMVFAPGACGASAGTGHVAVVDTVNAGKASATFVEQNPAGRRSCALSTATCFLHVVANGGAANADAGAPAGGSGGAPGTREEEPEQGRPSPPRGVDAAAPSLGAGGSSAGGGSGGPPAQSEPGGVGAAGSGASGAGGTSAPVPEAPSGGCDMGNASGAGGGLPSLVLVVAAALRRRRSRRP